MRRVAIFIVPGLLLSLIFFLFLGQLIGVSDRPKAEHSDMVHLTLTDHGNNNLQTRQRREPPPPPPKMAKMPSMPTTSANTSSPTDTPSVHPIDAQLTSSMSPADVQLSGMVGDLSQVQIASSIDTNPVAVSRVPPRYPQRALRHRIEGSVTIEFTVLPSGRVKPGSIKVIKADPERIFDRAVTQAVYGWRFQPKQQGGQAISYRARQTLEFKLEH